MISVRKHALLAVAFVTSAAGAQAVAVSQKGGSVAPSDEIPVTTTSSGARTPSPSGSDCSTSAAPAKRGSTFAWRSSRTRRSPTAT
jgi:hypothetical protein